MSLLRGVTDSSV